MASKKTLKVAVARLMGELSIVAKAISDARSHLVDVRMNSSHALLTEKRLVIGYGDEATVLAAACEGEIVQALKVYAPRASSQPKYRQVVRNVPVKIDDTQYVVVVDGAPSMMGTHDEAIAFLKACNSTKAFMRRATADDYAYRSEHTWVSEHSIL